MPRIFDSSLWPDRLGRLFRIRFLVFVGLAHAALGSNWAEADCTLDPGFPVWITKFSILPCDESIRTPYAFRIKGRCTNALDWVYWTVNDFDLTELVNKTRFDPSLVPDGQGGFTFQNVISFDLWCDDDCSELNGVDEDSDENPTRVFVKIEDDSDVFLGKTSGLYVWCEAVVTNGLASAPADAAITPNRNLAVVRAGGTVDGITVYNLITGDQLASFGSNSGPLGADAVEATDLRAVTLGAAGSTDSVHILDLTTNPPTSINSFGLSSAPYDVALTPDGTKAVVRAGGSGDAITVYNLLTGAQLVNLASNSGPMGADAVETTDLRAITLGAAGSTDSVHILDLTTNPPTSINTFSLSSAPYDVALTPDGTKAIVRAGASVDAITVYDLIFGTQLESFGSNAAPTSFDGHGASDAVVATDSRAIALGAGGESDSVHILDLTTNPPTSINMFGLSSAPHDVALSPDGTKAVVRAGGSGDAITVYDLTTGAQVATFASDSASEGALGFGSADAVEASDFRAITLGGAGATDSVRILDLTTNPPTSISTFGLSSAPHDVALSPDGTHAVVRAGGPGDAITVYDMITGAQIASFTSNSAPEGQSGEGAADAVGATNLRAITLGGAGSTDSVHIFEIVPPACTIDGPGSCYPKGHGGVCNVSRPVKRGNARQFEAPPMSCAVESNVP